MRCCLFLLAPAAAAAAISTAASVAPQAGQTLTCSQADLFLWGASPPEHEIGGSKAEMNRMKTLFYNTGQRRCTLCDAYLEASFSSHCGYVGHIARLGILERATAMLQNEITTDGTSLACGRKSSVSQKTKALLDMWWKRLNEVERDTLLDYKRIVALSAPTSKQRLWRVRFLLEFLRDREVIRDSLTLTKFTSSSDNSFVRTKRFERSEMIGDNIVKVVVPDRLVRLFPAAEGGVTYRLACIQQLLDSNEGLLQIYDYIDLNAIIGIRLPNNKTKADVVESLFGELQTFLWASEVACGMSQYSAIPNAEHRYVKALVEHLLNELTHMVIMWRIESTLENAMGFLEDHLQRRLAHKRNGVATDSGAVVVREGEHDRPRYAVLPLLLPHPYLSSSSKATSAGAKPVERRKVTQEVTRHLERKGTPMMLFATPVPRSALMMAHYRVRLRAVRSTKQYLSEVVSALSMKASVSELMTKATSPNDAMTRTNEGKRDKKHGEQKQHQHGGVPWGDLAAKKHPTWARDLELAEVRQHVDNHLTRRGVYVQTMDWNNMLAAVTRSLTKSTSLEEAPLLHKRPMKAPWRASQSVSADATGPHMLIELCGLPLAPTVR
ncbi:putative RNA editing complex protein MP67 [Trypanosoma grayi]|uniref:putative RNA editing complex protein MP67 n=1 Tax=Trypanosoma grayi TaxID=71804 RepID=UPI0004F41ED8|nr:putative RNA editing complex protein MP67 [Trypanosoma grayi]KEG11837.1 putative RNA editing complex protein MP67 [Trypanosoma grayi]